MRTPYGRLARARLIVKQTGTKYRPLESVTLDKHLVGSVLPLIVNGNQGTNVLGCLDIVFGLQKAEFNLIAQYR